MLVGYGPRPTEAKRRAAQDRRRRRPVAPAAAQAACSTRSRRTRPRHPTSALDDAAAADVPAESAAGSVRRGAPAPRGCWRSRRCASSPRTSASTSRPSPPPVPTASSPATTCRPRVAAPRLRADGRRASATPRPPVTGERETRDAGQGRAQDDRAGDGGVGVHGPARHRVDHRRRHPDDEAGRAAARPTASSATSRSRRCWSLARRSCSPSGVRRRSTRTWDEAAQEIVLKHYVNLGIAAATPRGLMVPNIKDADQLDAARAGPGARRAHRHRARGQDAAGRDERRHASPSPTSASSASTPARRSSTRASPRSSASARSASSRGSSATADQGRAGHHPGAVLRPPLVDGEQGSRFLADVAVSARGAGQRPALLARAGLTRVSVRRVG